MAAPYLCYTPFQFNQRTQSSSKLCFLTGLQLEVVSEPELQEPYFNVSRSRITPDLRRSTVEVNAHVSDILLRRKQQTCDPGLVRRRVSVHQDNQYHVIYCGGAKNGSSAPRHFSYSMISPVHSLLVEGKVCCITLPAIRSKHIGAQFVARKTNNAGHNWQ